MGESAFVGRRTELQRLVGVLRGDPGAVAAALVTGDAGIGKTRLLSELVRGVPGVLVLAGACLPLSESLPYGAISDALSHLEGPDGRPALEDALARCPPYVRPQLSALIPALSDGPPAIGGAATDRTRLFAAVRELLGALGAKRRTVLVVEDLHWADPGTLDLLTFLIRGLPAGTALIASSRREDLPEDDRIVDWLATTSRLPGVEPVPLGPLQPAEVTALVADLIDAEQAAGFVAEVLRRGEGNPFFTEQLVAAAGDVAAPGAAAERVPAGVGQMLARRVRCVSAAAQDVAAVLAVAARPLTEPELSRCLRSTGWATGTSVPAGLRDLLDAHLAEDARASQYRLRHALLEDTVRGTLLASQEQALHAGIAEVLAARDGESPAEVALHWAHAGKVGQEARWSVEAARHAEGLFAWSDATVLWRRVWRLWSSLPDDDRPAIELPDVVVSCVRDASRSDVTTDGYDDFLDLAREALADERVTADDEATARILGRYGDRLCMRDTAAGLAALERASVLFEAVARPSDAYAGTLRSLVLHRLETGDLTGTEEGDLARAADIAEPAGAVDYLIELATDRSHALLEAGRVDEAWTVLEEAQQRADAGDFWYGALSVAVAKADTCRWMLRLRDGVDAGRRGIAAARHGGLREFPDFATLVASTVDCLLLLGDTDFGADIVREYLMPGLTLRGWPLHLSRAELDVLAARPDESLAGVDRVEALGYAGDDMFLWAAEIGASADLWSSQPKSAQQRIDRVWTRVGSSPLAMHAGRILALGARAAADVADLDRRADRDDLARQLSERAEEARCFVPQAGHALNAAYGALFAGDLARLRRTGAESAWRSAREGWAGHDVPHHAAYAGWRLTECMLDSGRRRQAEEELAAAYRSAVGHLPLRAALEGLARRARLPLINEADRVAGVVVEPERDDVHGLTSREIEVLRLLGTGATNAEIGRRLFMSPKTASVHVTAILRKLGVSGRVQAATVAERMGLLDQD